MVATTGRGSHENLLPCRRDAHRELHAKRQAVERPTWCRRAISRANGPPGVPRSIDGAGRWRAAAYSHEGASPVVGGPPGPSAGSRRGGLWRRKLSAGFSRTFVFFFDLLLLWFCTVPRRDPSKTGKDGHGQ